MEYRAREIRAETTAETVTIRGLAVPYDSPTEIGDWFIERVDPDALSDSLDNQDIVLLTGHEGMPLARTGAGTMRLESRKDGLHFEADLDRRDTHAESIAIKLERRDLTGVSIGFVVEAAQWTFRDGRGELDERLITEAELLEVSLTPFPAYRDTDVELKEIRDSARQVVFGNKDGLQAPTRCPLDDAWDKAIAEDARLLSFGGRSI